MRVVSTWRACACLGGEPWGALLAGLPPICRAGFCGSSTPSILVLVSGRPVSHLVRLSTAPPPAMIREVHTQQKLAAREHGFGRGAWAGPCVAHRSGPLT